MPFRGFFIGSRTLALAIANGFLIAAFVGCTSTPIPMETEYLFQGPTMGTAYRVKVVSPHLSDAGKSRIDQAIQRELDNVNAKMSTYQSDSEISRFNRQRTTEPFPLSVDVIEVLSESQRISEATEGAFDITVGPLVDAWGFGPVKLDRIPSESRLAELRQSVGWEKIEIGAPATARKRHPATQADLSAIAKGYAVDRVSQTLADLDYGNHMVEVGGEVRTAGHGSTGKTWRIAIEQPILGRRAQQRIVRLNDGAMATSGDYRNLIEKDGVRYSHTIDPRSARPVTHLLASVTVIHLSCMTADAYATALMVMGEDEAFRFATAHDLAVMLLVRGEEGDFTERCTPAFEALQRS